MREFDERNNQWYLFLDDTFNLKKCKSWEQVSHQITIERISRAYKFYSKLFPRNIDYISWFDQGDHFRTMHFGNLRANSVINDVVRFALYSEEILVFHPLQNPSITRQSESPIKSPRRWLDDFVSALYFYVVIRKWVECGIVKLIINPVSFNFELRDELLQKAKKRVEKHLKGKDISSIEFQEHREELAYKFSHMYGNRPVSIIKQLLLELENPKFTEQQAEQFSEAIKRNYEVRNPLFEHLRIPSSTGFINTKNGGNLEELELITQLSGSNLYTSKMDTWRQIKDTNLNTFWTNTNFAISKTPMNFLDNVDTSFVLNLRKDNRLSSLRIELKKIFSKIDKIDLDHISEKDISEMSEEFVDIIRKSEAEWQLIKSEAENNRRYWALASVGIPLIQNQIGLIPLALGAVFGLAYSVNGEKIKLNHFKKKNPISVYVDLKHKNEGFFTEFKNCIY